jgi:hypothetical protein
MKGKRHLLNRRILMARLSRDCLSSCEAAEEKQPETTSAVGASTPSVIP